jgi:hypothetical protein
MTSRLNPDAPSTKKLNPDAPSTKKLGGNTQSMTKGMRTGVSKRSYGATTSQNSSKIKKF